MWPKYNCAPDQHAGQSLHTGVFLTLLTVQLFNELHAIAQWQQWL